MAEISVNFGTLDNADKICREAVAAGINKGITYLQGEMKKNMGSSGGAPSGHLAFRYKKNADGSHVSHENGTRKRFRTKKATYTAAPAGGFPGIRTGRLRQSIGIVPATPTALVASAGTNLDYGRWLEYGYNGKARDGTRFFVPARPWALRSFEGAKNTMIALCNETASNIIVAKLGGVK